MADHEKNLPLKEITPEKQTSLTGLFSEALDFVVKRDEAGCEERAKNLVLSASQLLREEYQKYSKLGFGGKELSGFPIKTMDKEKLIEKFKEQGIKDLIVGEKEIPQKVLLITDGSFGELDLEITYPRANYYLSYYFGLKKEYLKFIGNETEKGKSIELTIVRDKILPIDNFSVHAIFKSEQSDRGTAANCMVSLKEETSLDPF